MGNIEKFTEQLVKFRDERDWKKFCTPKDLAISLSIEVGEVLEHLQWKSSEEIKDYLLDEENKEKFGEELADVAIYLFYLASSSGVDLSEAIKNKIEKNSKKYPVQDVKGKHTNKY